MGPDLALSANEAASVTGVPLKQIHRMIDAGLLGGAVEVRGGSRVIRGIGLVGLKLAHDTSALLSPEGRRRLIGRLLEQPNAASIGEEPIKVDVRPMRSAVNRGLSMLDRAKRAVSIDKDILGGTPCFRGTRVPVQWIAEMIANGDERTEILKAYPSLRADQLDLAVVYNEAYPPRGRPSKTPFWRKSRPISSEIIKLADLPRRP